MALLENRLCAAAVVVLVVVLAVYTAMAWAPGQVRAPARAEGGQAPLGWADVAAGEGHRDACRKHNKRGCRTCARGYVCADGSPATGPLPDIPEQPGVYEELNRLYSTADVDPLITGGLYAHNDFVRDVYAERTSHGNVYGLTEYSSSGGPGDVGVDLGPFGLAEYGGREIGFDDGIPSEWQMPSTPVRWYAPKQRDYYGPEGPTPYTEGLYPVQEPDHDPLMN